MQEQAAACLQALTANLPQPTTICSLSLTSSSPCHSKLSQGPPEHARHQLCVTKHQQGSAPVLMHIPLPPGVLPATFDNGPQTPTAASEMSTATSAKSDLQGETTIGALRAFESILSDSAVSMKAGVPLETTADKSAWWRQRLALDKRMADLLKHLDTAWLGHWR